MRATARRWNRSSRNWPSATWRSRSRRVADSTRTSTDRARSPPTLRTSPRSITRSSLGCRARSRSPISSMSNVPPLACSNTPRRVAMAPVNAPRSCPNSSLSSRFAGTAVQSNTTKGPSARSPCSWIASASTSLPVPVSPSMITPTEERASLSHSGYSRRMARLSPSTRPNPVAKGTSGLSPSGWYCTETRVAPRRRLSPPRSQASLMATPSTQVPLVEPRSVMRSRLPTSSRAA